MKTMNVRQIQLHLPKWEGGGGIIFTINWDWGATWHPAWLDVFGLVANLAPEQDDPGLSSAGNRTATAVMPVEAVAKFLELLKRIPEEHQSVTSRSAIRRLSAQLTPLTVRFFAWAADLKEAKQPDS